MTTTTFTDLITDESQLRDVFGWLSARSLNKQIERLDQHGGETQPWRAPCVPASLARP
jgi:hypothetical protein